jgi:hypothetical protein
VPSWADYRIAQTGGSPGLTDRFTFQSGSFQAPPPETFRVNLDAYDQIVDNRIEGSPSFFKAPPSGLEVALYKTPAGVTTAAQLLPYSKKQAAHEAAAMANHGVPSPAPASSRWVIGWAVVMTACVLVLSWVVWSFRRSPRAA